MMEIKDNVDKSVEECLDKILKEMREINLTKSQEYRIAKSKIGVLRLSILKLYHDAFEQGIYAGKSE